MYSEKILLAHEATAWPRSGGSMVVMPGRPSVVIFALLILVGSIALAYAFGYVVGRLIV